MASPWIKNRPPKRHVLILDRHKRIEMSILHGNIMKTISRGFQAVRNSPLSQTNIVCGILRVVTGLVRRGFRSPLRRGVPLMMSRGGARRKVGYNQSCGSLQVDPDPDPLTVVKLQVHESYNTTRHKAIVYFKHVWTCMWSVSSCHHVTESAYSSSRSVCSETTMSFENNSPSLVG